MSKQIVIIGGGAAGFFGAINAAQANPEAEITIIEKSPRLLTKVSISGGGRCNVTHNCFDPKVLVENYPRGRKELLGPFNRFQPRDMIKWLDAQGVVLKTEADGRMFPVTDDSQTIIDCFMALSKRLGIKILTKIAVNTIEVLETGAFHVVLSTGEVLLADKILLATGGGQSASGFQLAQSLGHTINEPVPSLFTFNIKDPRIEGLAGISFPDAIVSVPGTPLKAKGPLLITHWGMSGPAVLKLSAWGARILYDKNYEFELKINFLAQYSKEQLTQAMLDAKAEFKKKQVSKHPILEIPKRFWEKMVQAAQIPDDKPWEKVSQQAFESLVSVLTEATYSVVGKSTNKDEFVTCGGIALKEVNFKTMESKICPGLFLAGEVLDIDGITGGFNFQAAWTCSWIAGNSM
ncbi:MAG: aminoacetone oxidase family FAD-binding enzyme [Verrucomicrobia bacterium CG_4_10_14_3_um_filter_43_23]|nr:MAG: flavoprotein [Verrucomicrobia bacterium CG1_02_43_26]PIP59048.1 MAG: aminoacetone oxidase family FAD-binding enzyme [Verrucomicrobia bacterium CG22_combo_CG10-13_8_21_14_all_43_17]PIX59145.1 MAG: aminoacetone oxidase family FAD-binding enzyme [Verrucomicrobia bacterium CG_4_10_14_3_um_filter_43_23]PIY61333.1 MAG: aminoacetone oxidase family FAD-binding enzyme [Verrucomicrobia bacterium CG_4_10_14_0_8_um_filter_43_34]PJA44114.1 MAG: aminoacetone oxidase family FAD-binding enzyme [Verruco